MPPTIPTEADAERRRDGHGADGHGSPKGHYGRADDAAEPDAAGEQGTQDQARPALTQQRHGVLIPGTIVGEVDFTRICHASIIRHGTDTGCLPGPWRAGPRTGGGQRYGLAARPPTRLSTGRGGNLWMPAPALWITRRFLWTVRWTALWITPTDTCHSTGDLRFRHPPAVCGK
jgi:hypothetical protein